MARRYAQLCVSIAFVALFYSVGVMSAARSYHNEVISTILGGNFSSFVRPVFDDRKATQVAMRMTFHQIRDMNEKNQMLTVNVWINLYWHDDFLVWDPNSFGNVTSIHLPSSRIWRPDIALYNSVDEERPSTELLSDTTAVVTSNGDITWSMPVIIKSACRLNVADYPFDIQRCPLKFGSWTYNGFELNLTNFADTAMLDNYESNGEWQLEGVPCVRHEILYKCCPEPYPDVTFTVVMKRRPMFYLFHLLFPCLLLTVIGLMTFCLPAESGEKVSLAVTVLLAMTVFMLVIMDNIPPTSEVVPLFEQFFGVTILVLAMTTIASVLVMNAHFRGLRGHRPPAWVRKLFLDWLAKIVCMHKMASTSYHVTDDGVLPVSYSPRGTDHDRHATYNGNGLSLPTISAHANTSPNHISNTWETDDGSRNHSHCNTPLTDSTDLAIQTILHLLHAQRSQSSHTTRKARAEEESAQAQVEWQLVAMVADRVMLVVFTAVVFVVCTVLFGGAPT